MNEKEGFARQRPIYLALCALLCACFSKGALGATTTTTFTYDAGGHVASVKDPRNLVTSYTYDGLGQLWQQVSPDTGTTSYGYDTYGRRSSMTRADGAVTTYGYDGLNRVTSVTAGGNAQSFSYDSCSNGVGRLCSASDSTGDTSYSYTPEGWLAGREFSIEGTTYSLTFGYDDMGRIRVVSYPDGNQAIYEYSDGTVSDVMLKVGGNSLAGASNIIYRPGNIAMTGWTSSNGLFNTLTFDNDGRLTGISVPNVQSIAFRYDSANRIATVTNGIDPSETQDYNYDDHSRLTAAYGMANNEQYTYDLNGNRISQTVNGAVNVFTISPVSNRLLSVKGSGLENYGYDMQGNLQSVNEVTTYQYNAFNRLSNTSGASNYVSPEGQRLRKTSLGGTTYFAPVSEWLLAEGHEGTWTDYVWLNGRMIGRISDGEAYAVHEDQTGRPEVVTDAMQAVVWSAQNSTFTRNVTANQISFNLGFPGQYYDAESGVWNNGYRDYNANLGRYIESDPIGLGGGVNTYVYGSNNPLQRIDPLGLESGYFSLYSSGVIDHLPEDSTGPKRADYYQFTLSYPPFLTRSYYISRTGTIFRADGVAISNPKSLIESFYPKNWKLGFNVSEGYLLCGSSNRAERGRQTDNYLVGAATGGGVYDGIGGGVVWNSSGAAIEMGVGVGGGSMGRGEAVPVGTFGGGW